MHEPLPAPFFPPPPLPAWLAGGKQDDKKKPDDDDDERGKGKERGPVRTQMIGESPGDDLGYDPSIIPTEKIPDED